MVNICAFSSTTLLPMVTLRQPIKEARKGFFVAIVFVKR